MQEIASAGCGDAAFCKQLLAVLEQHEHGAAGRHCAVDSLRAVALLGVGRCGQAMAYVVAAAPRAVLPIARLYLRTAAQWEDLASSLLAAASAFDAAEPARACAEAYLAVLSHVAEAFPPDVLLRALPSEARAAVFLPWLERAFCAPSARALQRSIGADARGID